MKMHVYNVYIDDGDAMKITVPAESAKKAAQYCEGNGEILMVREDPNIQNIDLDCLASTLRAAYWGQKEIDIITRCLMTCGLDR